MAVEEKQETQETQVYLVWPDGMWMLHDEYAEHECQMFGDDYAHVKVPINLEEGEEDFYTFIMKAVNPKGGDK